MLADEIETERLRLRPFSFRDVEAVQAYASDPEWARFEIAPWPYDLEGAARFVATAILCDRAVRPVWAITLDGETVGTAAIAFEQEWRIAALGYGLARRLWGQGLATEAVRAVVDQAFGACLMLRRIKAHTDARNARSIGLLRKLGFTQEGVLRANQINHDAFVDEAVFGLLREEWRG